MIKATEHRSYTLFFLFFFFNNSCELAVFEVVASVQRQKSLYSTDIVKSENRCKSKVDSGQLFSFIFTFQRGCALVSEQSV